MAATVFEQWKNSARANGIRTTSGSSTGSEGTRGLLCKRIFRRVGFSPPLRGACPSNVCRSGEGVNELARASPLPLGEDGRAKREPDRAKHQERPGEGKIRHV